MPSVQHENAADQTPDMLLLHRRGRTRTLRLHMLPILALGLVAGSGSVGAMLAGGYSLLQDDMLVAAVSQQERMQDAYEQRIAKLRRRIETVTQRQMLDQRAVDARVAELMDRQAKLGARQFHVSDAAKRSGRTTPSFTSIPIPRPAPRSLELGGIVGSASPFVSGADMARLRPEMVFDQVETSLDATERAQVAEIVSMQSEAVSKTRKLASILNEQGLSVQGATGGPLIELKGGVDFVESADALNESLDTLEKVRRAAKYLPHGSPVPGHEISSRFGTRRDPFTKRSAVHGGLDFRAPKGAKVRSTASGRVVFAGRRGGYGKLVEIDHGGGITTRYAHLSRIGVKKGARVVRGTQIGRVGSTGRSTGPHLHYEVRRKKQALNPIKYVRLEEKLRPFLD
ncbi:M23 family metallopeptidase [Rhizobiaceae bacterium]|nr:M23 family metallopeptidase [Rhizobiaceae bacterium]